MNVINSPVSQVDFENNKRKVLAKVYRILLSLSQEESSVATLDVGSTNGEIIKEPHSVKESLPTQ